MFFEKCFFKSVISVLFVFVRFFKSVCLVVFSCFCVCFCPKNPPGIPVVSHRWFLGKSFLSKAGSWGVLVWEARIPGVTKGPVL